MPKFVGYSYAVLRGEFIILNSYIRKDEHLKSIIYAPTSKTQKKKSRINP